MLRGVTGQDRHELVEGRGGKPRRGGGVREGGGEERMVRRREERVKV